MKKKEPALYFEDSSGTPHLLLDDGSEEFEILKGSIKRNISLKSILMVLDGKYTKIEKNKSKGRMIRREE